MTPAGLARPTLIQVVRASPHLTRALTTASVFAIVTLAFLRVVDAPWIVHAPLQLVLLASFTFLAVVDFKACVAIAIVELAVFGAGGRWSLFAGVLPGRIVLDAIVTVSAVAALARQWQRERHLDLGRYAPHALLLAIVLPGIWMTLGLINGNHPGDVFADGNGLAFFAMTIVLVVMLRDGHGPWLRHWLLVACAISAVVTGILIVATASGFVPMGPPLRQVLMDKLSFGGNFGYLPNGAYRLYLGSGIYLQVGLALTTWRLLNGPPRLWPWLLYALLWADVLATYTRGFWIGAVLAVGLTLALGAPNLRRPVAIAATSLLLFAIGSAAGSAVGLSLPDYVLNRTASTVSTGPGEAPAPTEPPAGPTEPPAGPTEAPAAPTPSGRDIAGEVSNAVRVEQVRVLLGHFVESPLIGHGFGSIAADYRYGQIFSYELAYLDLLYKTGLVGLLLFLSYPLRLLLDALRGRMRRLPLAAGVDPRETAVVVAIVVPLLITGGTNPYLLAAFGLFPILATVAWLDPLDANGDASRHR